MGVFLCKKITMCWMISNDFPLGYVQSEVLSELVNSSPAWVQNVASYLVFVGFYCILCLIWCWLFVLKPRLTKSQGINMHVLKKYNFQTFSTVFELHTIIVVKYKFTYISTWKLVNVKFTVKLSWELEHSIHYGRAYKNNLSLNIYLNISFKWMILIL